MTSWISNTLRRFGVRARTCGFAVGCAGYCATSIIGCKRVAELDSTRSTGSVTAAASASAASDGPKLSFAAIWGISATDIWAVGSKGTIGHYDGHVWSRTDSPTTKNLSAIAGSGRADIWAVGDEGTTLHYDGSSWTSVAENKDETLLGIWAGSKTDVWVSGVDEDVGVIRHFDGKTWDNADVTGATSLWETWASGPTDIWMVGSDRTGRGFVLQGNGKHFERVPFEGGSLRSIWGTKANELWIATYDGPVFQWNGVTKKWTESPKSPTEKLLGLWGVGSADIWAVGLGGGAFHFDGQSWSKTGTGTNEAFWAAWGSSSSDVWIVGTGGAVRHWNGREWAR